MDKGRQRAWKVIPLIDASFPLERAKDAFRLYEKNTRPDGTRLNREHFARKTTHALTTSPARGRGLWLLYAFEPVVC
jgi:hypothetical protein